MEERQRLPPPADGGRVLSVPHDDHSVQGRQPQVVGPPAHEIAQVDDERSLHEGHVNPTRRILVFGNLQAGTVALGSKQHEQKQ